MHRLIVDRTGWEGNDASLAWAAPERLVAWDCLESTHSM